MSPLPAPIVPTPPTVGWRGWFDGAAEPTNPGERSIGGLLLGPEGQRIEISEARGHGTNNEAEYMALIAVLQAAIAAGAASVAIFGDSQVVVNQVRGAWAVKSPTLQAYCAQAKPLLRLAKARISWVPREENEPADVLSKRALIGVVPGLVDMAGWGNLTAVGKELGISAVAVGKRLTARALKEGKKPTALACESGVARIRTTFFGSEIDWHIAKLGELLRTETV